MGWIEDWKEKNSHIFHGTVFRKMCDSCSDFQLLLLRIERSAETTNSGIFNDQNKYINFKIFYRFFNLFLKILWTCMLEFDEPFRNKEIFNDLFLLSVQIVKKQTFFGYYLTPWTRISDPGSQNVADLDPKHDFYIFKMFKTMKERGRSSWQDKTSTFH